MEGLVNQLGDGTLGPLKRSFTELHVKSCPQCSLFLENLQKLHCKLQSSSEEGLSEETLSRIRAKAVLFEDETTEECESE